MLWFWILVILWWESFERWLVVPHDVKEIGIHLITYEIWCKFILLSIRTTKIKLVGFWIIESLNSCIVENARVFINHNRWLKARHQRRIIEGETYNQISLLDVGFNDEWITKREDAIRKSSW